MKREKEYIVTVTRSLYFGTGHFNNTYAITAESMKEAKEIAIRRNLTPYTIEVHAHKVKPNEIVPNEYYNWLYA